MSKENVEAVLAAVDAVNKRDPDAFIACLHPRSNGRSAAIRFRGCEGTYRGQTELRTWFEEAVAELWESLHVEVEEITEVPEDRVFLGFLLTARGRASGVETELRGWQVLLCADGKVARRQGPFWARDEALEAAGLRE
jgi:hypothetical protein